MSMIGKAINAILLPASVAMASLFVFEAHALDQKEIQGRWKSESIENLGQIYGHRDFNFDQDSWSITFKAFGDAEGNLELFRLNVGGSYIIGNGSDSEGQSPANFTVLHRTIQTGTEAGKTMFESMRCALEINREKDLTNEACGFIPAIMASGIEYDLLSLKDNKLYLGDRSGDLSKERPEKLTAYPLVKN